MKKILGFILAAAVCVSSATAVFAETTPIVKVDGRTVNFTGDQAPVIMNDRTYVPLRRVLERMGAKVSWDDEKKMVTVKSVDNVIMIRLTIDNPEISVFTFTSVLHADEEVIKSDVAPVIMNDRTMLPIRVVAEALGATVDWNEKLYLTEITTKEAKADFEIADEDAFDIAEAAETAADAKLTLSCDSEDVSKGDTVKVRMSIADMADTTKIVGVTAGIVYDKSKFEFVKGTLLSADGEVTPFVEGANADYYDNCVKMISLVISDNAYMPAEDGGILEVEFKALSDEGGSFAISDGVSDLGYDTEILISDDEGVRAIADFDKLYIDTTAVEVK